MSEPPKKLPRTERTTSGAVRDHGAMEREEEENFKTGPFSLLTAAANSSTSLVLIMCRNDHKMLGRLRAFDRHFNMVLENVYEMWTDQLSKADKAAGKVAEAKQKHIKRVFLRGDNVVLVTKVDG